MADERLSEHFLLSEFTHSETAIANGIKNNPTKVHLKTLKHTCEYCLEKLHKLLSEHYNARIAITITSGYRSKTLNTKIKGSKTSQHLDGSAADIKAEVVLKGKRILIGYNALYELIKMWVKQGKMSVDQCILEKSGDAVWVHISHSPSGSTVDRREFLKYNNGKYTLDCILR